MHLPLEPLVFQWWTRVLQVPSIEDPPLGLLHSVCRDTREYCSRGHCLDIWSNPGPQRDLLSSLRVLRYRHPSFSPCHCYYHCHLSCCLDYRWVVERESGRCCLWQRVYRHCAPLENTGLVVIRFVFYRLPKTVCAWVISCNIPF